MLYGIGCDLCEVARAFLADNLMNLEKLPKTS